jgi:hypothetical protein
VDRLRLFVALATAGALSAPIEARAERDAAFLAGYATAVLERELRVRPARVEAREGALRVELEAADAAERDRVEAALREIETLDSLEVVVAAGAAPEGAGLELLPPGQIFQPLLADPRWPHFSASFQRYVGDDELGNVAAVSFGDTIALLRHDAGGEGRFELVLHAGVFSIFDIDAESFDLVNSDFLVGPALAWQRGSLSAMVRLFHQSSHLGDEFLLRESVDRINLSYEALDALVSWHPAETLRVYAGGGWLLRREPSSLDRGSLQAGLEATSPRAWAGHVRPVLGVDVQSRQEHGWDVDLSARAGIQLESPRLASKRLQILIDYYQGHSPNGQFFDREIEYWALGAHLHF